MNDHTNESRIVTTHSRNEWSLTPTGWAVVILAGMVGLVVIGFVFGVFFSK